MSLYLQIALPLLVAFLVLMAVAILRKYIKPETVIICFLLFGLGAYTTVMHFLLPKPQPVIRLSDGDILSLMIAEECILAEQYDDALEILSGMQRTDGVADQVSLNMARCMLLKGNYSAAAKAYETVATVSEKEKAQAVALYSTTQSRDNAVIHYLSSNGQDPDKYGLQATPVATGDVEAAREEINDSISAHLTESADSYGDDFAESARLCANIISRFNDYLANDYDELIEVKRNLSDLLGDLIGCIEDRPEIAENPHIRDSRLMGHIVLEEYRDIAEEADEYSTPEELLVLAELYVKNLIDEDDFSEDYAVTNEEALEEMIDFCREGLEEHKNSLSKEHYEKYKDSLESIGKYTDNLVLFTLRYRILDSAQNGDIALSSKSYMAIAKIEHYSDNEELSDIYLSEALGTAPNSDDENYRKPMISIMSILEGTSNDVKNIANYVDEALDNSLPAKVPTPVGTPNASESFSDHVTDTVSQGTATINIGVIDKSNFPEVKVRIQLKSDIYTTMDQLKDNMKVYDCGSQITDFTLEKLEFSSSKILLLCDVSGSMSGSVNSLKTAIISFAENMTPGEWVSVVGFDNQIAFNHDFSSNPETVKGYANSVYAGGGTNLFGSLLEVGDDFPSDLDGNNIIIAMTDGQDGYRASEQEIYEKIGAMASDKSLIVYTLGLGSSVDDEYLEMIASAGGGSFLYVDSDTSLDSFYAFIHGQLSNQYVLTYTAKNQTLNNRKLEISLDSVMGGNAEKNYYLVEPEHTDTDIDSYNPYRVEDATIAVNGLTAKFLYKSSLDNVVNLMGGGFDSGDDIVVRLSGNVKYNLEATYKDENTYEVVIPAEIAVGTYDLTVSIRGESVSFEDELTVAVPGTEKSLRFGAYSFTALNSYVDNKGDTVLSGNVVMNGWLHFKGDIKISNDYYDSGKIYVTDNSGAYISYSGTSAEGLAKYMGEKGISFSLGALGEFSLTNLPYSPDNYEDFQVDDIELDKANVLLFSVEIPKLYVYPDMLMVQGGNLHFDLPFQKQLMRGLDIDSYFKSNFDSDIMFTATRICMTAQFDYSAEGENDGFTMVSLPLSLSELSLGINTLENSYNIGATVKLKAMKNMEAIKFNYVVKNGRFDTIELTAEGAKKLLTATPVPMSLGDFSVKAEGFSDRDSNTSCLEQVLSEDISFGFKFEVASLNQFLPDIAKLISDEDVSLASLENCWVTANLKNFRFSFEADLVLMSMFDLAKCKVDLGKFSYSNHLVGLDNVDECGFRITKTSDISCDLANVDVSLRGKEEITIGAPYSGMWFSGDADFDIDWWLVHTDFDVRGDAMVGVFTNSSDKLQFSFIVRGQNSKGKYSGFNISITESSGFDIHKY